MFNKARFKLTTYYLGIILTITISLSLVFYQRSSTIIKAELNRVEQRIYQGGDFPLMPKPPDPNHLRLLTKNLKTAESNLIRQLILINLLIAFFTSFASYFLAGKTLRPLEEAHLKQKRFVADAAHELRTPIAALKTNLEVNLLDKKIKKSTKEILQTNLVEIENLEILTKGLLKLANNQKVEFKKIDINQLITKAIAQINVLTKNKKIKIVYQDPKQKIFVKANPSLILELLLILLDNAIKYSQNNSKVIIKLEESSHKVVVTVRDFAKGISEKDLPFIFDRFYRADKSRSQSGHGLGLSIAKQITDLHSGTITVKSKVNKGSVFKFTLAK